MPATVRNIDQCAKILEAQVGNEHLCPAASADAVDGVQPTWVAEPADAAQLARLLSVANRLGLKVIARGGATKMEWGNPPRSVDLIISTRRLNRVIEHAAADMTATVQAGCAVSAFQQTLAGQGQRLALDPLWSDCATIGGILAANDSGPLRFAYGSLRDLLIGITIALPDGTIARSGGKVVKNVAGYDLPKLLIGSFGTLGVIVEATFRLHPLPHQVRDLSFQISPAQLPGLIEAIMASSLLIAAAQIELSPAGPMDLRVRIEALPGSMQPKCDRVTEAIQRAGASPVHTPDDPWSKRQRLFDTPSAVVCKVSVLPTHWPRLHAKLLSIASPLVLEWNLAAQITGIGLVCVGAGDDQALLAAVKDLRQMVSDIGGSLFVLRCPASFKAKLNAWPEPGEAILVMRKLKEQFDPKETLAPGRFVGGI